MLQTKTIEQQGYEMRFQWVAVYKDGTELKQNFGKDDEHHFGHIEQDKLRLFQLETETGSRVVTVDLENQYIEIYPEIFYVEFPRDAAGNVVKGKLVYFRRVRNDYTPNGVDVSVRHCVGLQANIDGINKQQYVFINSDGTFTLSQQK